MEKFDEILQRFVNLEYDELVSVGKKALSRLMPLCRKLDEKHQGMMLVSSLVLSAVAADQELTVREIAFLGDVLGVSLEHMKTFISLYTPDMDELTDDFADALADEAKADVLTLLIAVAACDEKITRNETAFIRKIME